MRSVTETPAAQADTEKRSEQQRRPAKVRSAAFKYYIHDGSDTCRLQLIGEFTETEVAELNGCWRTARTTLGKRKLVLDLQSLRAVDDAAKRWIASMAQEGATYVPESFLRDSLADHSLDDEVPKATLLSKLIAIFRGTRVPATD